jgi:hypothetical protein
VFDIVRLRSIRWSSITARFAKSWEREWELAEPLCLLSSNASGTHFGVRKLMVFLYLTYGIVLSIGFWQSTDQQSNISNQIID